MSCMCRGNKTLKVLNYTTKLYLKITQKGLYEISNTYKQTMKYHSGFNMEYNYGGIRWLNKYTAKTMKSACQQHSLSLSKL